ncbi:MAG: amidohydrolase family protein, partial [Candidatus Bipolaricaulota bacterium]|nr:amidohydrolase family protein [Candidatus Bipolaricaulota bacterium]
RQMCIRDRVLTLAPELPGALELIAEVRRIGAVPALGHTEATYEEASAALAAGAGHVVHLGNAMSGLGHRAPGALGAALLARASLELVLDGVHVHPAFVRLVVEFLRGRGELSRLCLVSDATAAAGMPDGVYPLGGREVQLRGGEVRLPDGTLAGSALTLDQALRNAVRFGGLSLAEALPLVTANPARVVGRTGGLAELVVGARADLILLGSDLQVEPVFP